MKKALAIFLIALLAAVAAKTYHAFVKPGQIVAQDGKYLKLAWTRLAEIGETTGLCPSSVSELAAGVSDPELKGWLLENADRITLPLAGQCIDGSTDTKLPVLELRPKDTRSGGLGISLGGAAKIRDFKR